MSIFNTPRNPLFDLKDWIQIHPNEAEEGDLIFYFRNPDHFPNVYAEHYGILNQVKERPNANPALAVLSKWGPDFVYHHDADKVPEMYGDYFFLMRSPYQKLARQSIQAKFYPRYRKFAVAAAVLALSLAAQYVSVVLNRSALSDSDWGD